MVGISREQRQALAEVKSRFTPRELDDETLAAVERLSAQYVKLAAELQRTLPEGRNKSLAMTHLEDAAMRTTRALSHDAPGEGEADEPTEGAVEVQPREAAPRRRTAKEKPAEEGAKKVTRRVPRRRAASSEAPAEQDEAVPA